MAASDRYAKHEAGLVVAVDSGIALLKLNRPEKYNAMDEKLHRAMAEVFPPLFSRCPGRLALRSPS
jgi:hypothetical protein